jgi:hypothetical protein
MDRALLTRLRSVLFDILNKNITKARHLLRGRDDPADVFCFAAAFTEGE